MSGNMEFPNSTAHGDARPSNAVQGSGPCQLPETEPSSRTWFPPILREKRAHPLLVLFFRSPAFRRCRGYHSCLCPLLRCLQKCHLCRSDHRVASNDCCELLLAPTFSARGARG